MKAPELYTRTFRHDRAMDHECLNDKAVTSDPNLVHVMESNSRG